MRAAPTLFTRFATVIRRPRGWTSRIAHRWTLFAILVVVWQFATAAANNAYFPTPWQIARVAGTLWLTTTYGGFGPSDTVVRDVVPSLARAVGGWALAAVVGVALGIGLGRSRTALHYLGPLIAFFRGLPSPALIPVFILLFGIDTAMKLSLITFAALWPILLNTVDGARSVDPVQADTARSLRLPRARWIGMVVIPAALPKIFAGLRISLAIALIVMVVSEMVGVTSGIGYQLRYAQSQFDFTAMWAWIVLLGLIGYLLTLALLLVERRALRWRPTRATQTLAHAHPGG